MGLGSLALVPMNTQTMPLPSDAQAPIWNTDILLPLVTDEPALMDHQILLGGLSLVLSRLHPIYGKSRFLATRNLAQRLRRSLQYKDASRAHLVSEELRCALTECERTLDPGSLMVMRRLFASVSSQEAQARDHQELQDFTYSDFIAEEKLIAGATGAAALRAH